MPAPKEVSLNCSKESVRPGISQALLITPLSKQWCSQHFSLLSSSFCWHTTLYLGEKSAMTSIGKNE